MTLVTGDRYLESLVKFVESHAEPLIEGSLVLKLNPIGLHYVHSRLEALAELESLLAGAPVDYLRAYVSDLGDHRALEQLRRILCRIPSLKVVSVLPPPARDPSPLSLLPFTRLKILELRGCDLSTSAARGLLELRHSLEKLICHNSTDALRHVFASRIADIKASRQWNRLSFVSCACNGLLLMDESLHLLPAVETLDLSRNKFAKVDNLRKCTKLKLLDLGFNHLRSISSFGEVSCSIINLVLRNNTLTTLHGIENLKSLVGLDISNNVISNFSEIEVLAELPCLQNLWLEGNPICCASWYRAHVFSFFHHPHQLNLDEEKPTTSDLWKRKVILASRQKQPASFGFYAPARDSPEVAGINTKRKKASRLASIKNQEDITLLASDQDSVSCENDNHSRVESVNSDQESEIVDLMKKKPSDLWLQKFKDWMDYESGNFFSPSKFKENVSFKKQGETSEPGQFSADVHGTNPRKDLNTRISPFDSFVTAEGDSYSSFTSIGSPPHYKEDILHRRHNLEEEFLQLSTESLSIASSDSDTSCSEDDSVESLPVMPQVDQSVTERSEEIDKRVAEVQEVSLLLEKRKPKRRPKKRMVSLVEDEIEQPRRRANENVNSCRGDEEFLANLLNASIEA